MAQAGLGYTQYFNGVPPVLVGFHVAGATAVFSATIAVLLGMYEAVPRRRGLAPPGPVADLTRPAAPPPATDPANVAGAAVPPQ